MGLFEFEDGGDEDAEEGSCLTAEAALAAEEGEEARGVGDAVGARVRGGEHLVVEAGEERDDVGVVDAEEGILGGEGGEGRIGAIAGGEFEGESGGAAFPVFGEDDFDGVEAVPGVVAGGAGFALWGAGAGGLAGVGAVGGEAPGGEGMRHGYFPRLAPARWQVRWRKWRVPRMRSEREARQAGSLWNSFQARTVRREGVALG